ncbi:MAG: LysR family transcriptional regulator [Chloroflexi bacterium]|nr:LysR family transcriptional regulator [Chloroflexota bacterium]
MTEDQLLAFLSVARYRSLSRAASELDLGQPTISDRLRSLERELGATLVRRQGRGVALTPEGEAFLSYAQRALEVLKQGKDMVRAAHTGSGGRVSIAVTVTTGAYLFAPALVAFQKEHPDIEVQVRSAHSWESPGLLLDDVVQLALISGPIVQPQIETVMVFRSKLICVAGSTHRARALSRSVLAADRLLVSYWGPAYQSFLEEVKTSAPDGGRNWLELSPVELVKGLLIAGVGVSIIPAISARLEIEAGTLIELPLADVTLPDWQIALVRRNNRAANPAADVLAASLARTLETVTRL